MRETSKARVDWSVQETRQFETYLQDCSAKDKQASIAVLVAQAMQLMPEHRRRSTITAKLHQQAAAFLRDGTPLTTRANASKEPPTTVRVGKEGQIPSPVIITRPNGAAPAPAPAVSAPAAPAVVPAVPATTIAPAVDAFLDAAEDKAVDWLVSVADRVLSHPAIVRGLHGLVRSAFEKDVATAIDKTTGTWSEQGPSARLPRVLVAGVTPKDTTWKENLVQQYGASIALRFWDEQSQSKGQLKQMLHGSHSVVILTDNLSHGAFQMIKARSKNPPIFAGGGNAVAVQALERLAKQSIIQQATGATT